MSTISLDPNIPILLLGLLVGWVGGCSLVDALFNSSSKREVLERYRTTGIRVAGYIVEHTCTVHSSRYVICPCFKIRTAVDYVVYYRYAYPPPPRPGDPTAATEDGYENEEEPESGAAVPSSVHTRYFHQGTYGPCAADIEPLPNPCPVIVLPDVPTSGILQRDLDRRFTKTCGCFPRNSIPAFLALLVGSFLTACGLLSFDAHFTDLVVVASVLCVPVLVLLGLPTKGRLLRLWKRRLTEDTVDASRRFWGREQRYNRLPTTGTGPSTSSCANVNDRDKVDPESKPVTGSVQMAEQHIKTLPDGDIPEVV